MRGEDAFVERGLGDVRASGGAERAEAGLGKGSSSSAGRTEGRVGAAEKASRRLEAECGQCHAKPSVSGGRGDAARRNGARGGGRIQTQKHASLLFVCLFVKRKL